MNISKATLLPSAELKLRETTPHEPVVLEAVAELFEALNREGLRYCHWKSNLRLEKSLRGRTDLDLLVDGDQAETFKVLLREHDLKLAYSPAGRHYPEIENYLGFDPASGGLFHLHVHYQLVLGEQFVKNYRLPLERQFLDSAHQRLGVKIPAPELELIVLSLRALLKYRDRDALKDILSIRSPGLPVQILEEFHFLLSQTSAERLRQTLDGLGNILPGRVVLEFLSAIQATPRAGYQLFRLRQQVRRALRRHQRLDRWQAVARYFAETWRRRSFFRASPVRKMTLENGGLTLALIGADGAGKTTLVQAISKWLSWKLDVAVFYLGSKKPSFQSRFFYLVVRLARRGQGLLERAFGKGNFLATTMGGMRDILLFSHYLSIGFDRYRRLQAGRVRAQAGSIVIFDRYPLYSLNGRSPHRLMDGPQIHLLNEGKSSGLQNWFSRLEKKRYRQIRSPDRLFVLQVSPQVAVQRKPDHNQATIETKIQTLGEVLLTASTENNHLRLAYVDADRPLEEVLLALKKKVWEEI